MKHCETVGHLTTPVVCKSLGNGRWDVWDGPGWGTVRLIHDSLVRMKMKDVSSLPEKLIMAVRNRAFNRNIEETHHL